MFEYIRCVLYGLCGRSFQFIFVLVFVCLFVCLNTSGVFCTNDASTRKTWECLSGWGGVNDFFFGGGGGWEWGLGRGRVSPRIQCEQVFMPPPPPPSTPFIPNSVLIAFQRD